MLMAVAMAMPANAQLKFGLQAGLNLDNISKSDLAATIKNRTGFFVGPTVKFTLPIIGLGFDAAALYDQREGKVEGNGVSETVKSQSIQIPINVRYGVGLGDLAEIFLFAGPQFGINVGGKKTFSEIDWKLKSTNLSANVGIGATIMSHLQAKFNYNVALGKTGEFEVQDAAKEAAKQIIKGGNSTKFNSWQISLAYYF